MILYDTDYDASSEATTKRKVKGKVLRKWGDQVLTETEIASLDFSEDKFDSDGQAGSHDVQALVDQSSLGTRTRDGLYEVKDWEFSKEGDDDADDIIARALKPVEAKTKSTSSSLGALGSIFARLTGSKVLTEEDLKPVLDAMKQHLMKKNVAKDTSEKVCEGVGESLVGKKVGGFQSMLFTFLVNLLLTPIAIQQRAPWFASHFPRPLHEFSPQRPPPICYCP
jgi:signal recognition particle receptor subunit alpha